MSNTDSGDAATETEGRSGTANGGDGRVSTSVVGTAFSAEVALDLTLDGDLELVDGAVLEHSEAL